MNLKLDNNYIELFFYLFLPAIIIIIIIFLAFTNVLTLLNKKERDKKYIRRHIIISILFLFILIMDHYKGEIEKYIRLNYPNLYGKYLTTIIDNKEYVVLQVIKNDYIIADIKREDKKLIIYRDTIKKYKFPGIMEFYYDDFDNVKVEDKEEKQ